MGQLAPAIEVPSKEDRWRYCCHLEGDVPIELQLVSARDNAKEAVQPQTHGQGLSPGMHWSSEQSPGQAQAWPSMTVPHWTPQRTGARMDDREHFPEVVRSVRSKKAQTPSSS